MTEQKIFLTGPWNDPKNAGMFSELMKSRLSENTIIFREKLRSLHKQVITPRMHPETEEKLSKMDAMLLQIYIEGLQKGCIISMVTIKAEEDLKKSREQSNPPKQQ